MAEGKLRRYRKYVLIPVTVVPTLCLDNVWLTVVENARQRWAVSSFILRIVPFSRPITQTLRLT